MEMFFPPRVTRRLGSIGTMGIVLLAVAVVVVAVVVALLGTYDGEPFLLLTSR
jgi:hypothetical protein